MSEIDVKILAYSLLEKKFLIELQSSITPEYFRTDYRSFYKLMVMCFSKFREIPTEKVMEEQAPKVWEEYELKKIYSEVASIEVDLREFPSDLEKLKERYNTKVLQNFGKSLFKENWDGQGFKDLKDANLSVKKLSVALSGIYSKKIFKEGALSETVDDAWNRYKQVKENPDLAKGIHLGLREFDRITNGMQKSELMLVGGESSAGKSALAMNMAINAWLGKNRPPKNRDEKMEFDDSGCHVLYFSIEMPYEKMRRRVDANVAGVPLYGIRDGTLTEEEEEKLKLALKFQKNYPKQFRIIDVPRGCTMSQIESKYIEICDDYVPELIVIDYITLMTMDSDSEGQDWLSIGKVVEQMHEFCRTYETRIISPVQLNRPPKSNGKDSTGPADQHRIGRSIMLSQNSDIVLNIETRKDEEQRPDMVVRIAKMRDGEKGAFILQKALHMMRIYDDIPEWSPEIYHATE